MANPDGIKGIGGDRTFMDAYYLYVKRKKELRDNERENNSRENMERESCNYYLIAVSRCLTQINSLPDGDVKRNYLDWLRWNTGIIVAELERFEDIVHLQDLVPTISVCKQDIETVVQRYFQLAEDEKAVSNQYVHAYASIIRHENRSVNIYNRKLQHSGRLLINYVNYLKDRCYVHKLDRSETSNEQLQGEADYLLTGLTGVDDDLARNIKTAIEQYASFRELDNAAYAGQDEIMKYALLLAHKRATENFLETVIRRIQETISLIQQKTMEKLEKAMETTAVLFSPILHPIDALHKVGYLVKHTRSNGLLKTLEEIWNWAKESPWKSVTIVLGGLTIGACVVGLPLACVAYAADVALTSITLSPAVYIGTTCVGTAVGAVPCIQAAVATGNVLHIKAKSQIEIAIEKAKEKKLMNENEGEGRKIADEVKFDRIKREAHKMADEIADEQIRRAREEERQFEEVTKSRVNSMELQQLNAAESELKNGQEELERNLTAIRSEFRRSHEELLQTQRDMATVLGARAAAARLMEKCGKKSTAANGECDNEWLR